MPPPKRHGSELSHHGSTGCGHASHARLDHLVGLRARGADDAAVAAGHARLALGSYPTYESKKVHSVLCTECTFCDPCISYGLVANGEGRVVDVAHGP